MKICSPLLNNEYTVDSSIFITNGGHFVDGLFVDRHFVEDISSSGLFVEWIFGRMDISSTDFWSKGHFLSVIY